MYTNNTEYRATLRAYFKMNTRDLETTYNELKTDDPESYDELMYDEEAMKLGILTIYDATKDEPRFCDLYRKAAGQFLTEDLEIGICVLLTYDYFADFIRVYENPLDMELYETLYGRL
jgi:hypothetical protein